MNHPSHMSQCLLPHRMAQIKIYLLIFHWSTTEAVTLLLGKRMQRERKKTKSGSSLLNMLIIKKGSLCKSILCTYQDLYISALLPFKSCSAQWAKLLFWCDWGWQYNFGLQNVQALIQENTSQGSNHDRRIISQSWGRKSRLQCCRRGGTTF